MVPLTRPADAAGEWEAETDDRMSSLRQFISHPQVIRDTPT